MSRLKRAPGAIRYMNGLRNAEAKGYAAGLDKNFAERDCPYRGFEHRHFWLEGFKRARTRPHGGKDG